MTNLQHIDPRIPILLPPPDHPTDVCTDGDWLRLEQRLGTRLPDDVKEFNRLYGLGEIGDWMMPLVPRLRRGPDWLEEQCGAAGVVQIVSDGLDPRARPLRAFPMVGGALAWAASNNGDFWVWLTTGEPEEWTVAVIPRHPDSHLNADGTLSWTSIYFYDMGATTYLAELIGGRLTDKFTVGVTATFDLSDFKPWLWREHL